MAQAQQSRGSRKGSTGNSPLASLAGKATAASATATNEPRAPKNYTGQYWFDRFLGKVDGKEEQTKLAIIKQAATAVDVASLKKSLDDMVEIASKHDEQAGFKDKQKNKGPSYRTAVNTRTVLQKCYGALRFADDVLPKHGYTETIGFHAFAVIAKKALDEKEVKWTGIKAEAPELRKAKRDFKREEDALKQVQKDHPRQVGQSFEAWHKQCMSMVNAQLTRMEEEDRMETIGKELKRLQENYKPEMLQALADAINIMLQEGEHAAANVDAEEEALV